MSLSEMPHEEYLRRNLVHCGSAGVRAGTSKEHSGIGSRPLSDRRNGLSLNWRAWCRVPLQASTRSRCGATPPRTRRNDGHQTGESK